jgi:predicted HicB family RNase H-like nuclease
MSKQQYLGNFDNDIYSKFKKLAKKNNKSLNHYLNRRIEDLQYNLPLQRYSDDKNYSKKRISLEDENHKLAKNMLYIEEITIRDYVQSVMEESLKREI